MADVVKCAHKRTAESDLRYYLLSQHARHNPLCKFFEQLKRESALPLAASQPESLSSSFQTTETRTVKVSANVNLKQLHT